MAYRQNLTNATNYLFIPNKQKSGLGLTFEPVKEL